MKNWADHCSSDEEGDSHDELVVTPTLPPKMDEPAEEEDAPLEEQPAPAPRTYDFPTGPPFTAFVGNLAYSVDDPARLAEEISKLAEDKLGLDVRVFNARIMMDRKAEKPRHRGFGYIEVDSIDHLKALMDLNETDAQIAGRKIQLDTANASSRPPDRARRSTSSGAGIDGIDGSQFRGGRFAKRGSARRDDEGGDRGEEKPMQRTSLKLAPRTKPVADGTAASSNIFGGGKARDETSWRDRRKSETKDAQPPRRNSKNTEGGAGRRPSDSKASEGGFGRRASDSKGSAEGGAGRRGSAGRTPGGRGRGGGRDGKGIQTSNGSGRGGAKAEVAKKDKDGSKDVVVETKKKATATPAPTPVEPEKPATKTVVNKFALLQVDSDSD